MIASGTLGRLLMRLPEYFDRAPYPEAAIQLQPAAPITVTVAQHRLITEVTPGSGMLPLDIDLINHTLATLVAQFQAFPGYGATLLDDDEAGAGTLLDLDAVVIDTAGQLQRFTSVLWTLMSPIAWELDAVQDRIRSGLQEFSVRTADGLWLDRWAVEFYGGVLRMLGETDPVYAARVIKEVTRWRVNGLAIEQILDEDLGVSPVVISNLHDRAWVVSDTPFGFLAGRKYSRTTFEVRAEGSSSELWRLTDRNRAAGTLPFYVTISTPTQVDVEEEAQVRLSPLFRSPIGTDLGASPDNCALVATIVSRKMEQVLKDAAALDFNLGTARLGLYSLGPAAGSSAVIDITEAWTAWKNGVPV